MLTASWVGPGVKRFRVFAPRVARYWRAGQFVIVRSGTDSERIPLTIAEGDPAEGWIGLVVQSVGASTTAINALEPGDAFTDLSGPLGTPSRVEPVGTVVVIGGGVGTAIAYPTAVAHALIGNAVVAIVGGRSAEQVLLTEELSQVCERVISCTDDGSAGVHGLVTDVLTRVMGERHVDLVVAIGPTAMMRAVAELTRGPGIPTIVSLNPIMVDGTGMCGGCRVAVDGETRFACVDGPEFDAHLVDFDVLAARNRSYREFEQRHACEAGG